MATARSRVRTIKPPQRFGPDFNPKKTWAVLEKNIVEIMNHNAMNLSFEENHRYAYNMVLFKEGKMLYDGVARLVKENLLKLAERDVQPKFPTQNTVRDREQRKGENEELLKAVKDVWDDHKSTMYRLGQILKYMDRVYTKAHNVPETWDAGVELFLECIMRPPILSHLITGILDQIQFERDGHAINRSAVKGCVDVLLGLNSGDGKQTLYKRDLEKPFLEASGKFYEIEGIRLVESCTAPEFLTQVQGRLEAEESRTQHYLSRHTSPELQRILCKRLLTDHLPTVLAMPTGLDYMIDLEQIQHLTRLYRLFTLTPDGMPLLKRALRDSILRRGKDVNRVSQSIDNVEKEATANSSGANAAESAGGDSVTDADTSGKAKGKAKEKKRPPPHAGAQQTLQLALKWVQDILDLKDKFENVWKSAFSKDRELESALNEAFESFININNRSSEFISLFIDDHLKRGFKGKSDAEIESILDKTIIVFRYIVEKDAFERYYKGHLAKRLLAGRSVSDDAERGMLAKLKVECGFQFTQKLEGMFKDIEVSSDAMNKYRNYLARTTAPEVELSVIVMTSTFWPMSQAPAPCTLPSTLLRACQSFEKFYHSQHTGRRLTWQPNLGNADVHTRFKKRSHDLNVSTYALVILLLFEELGDDDFLTYEEIKESTGIVDSELQRHLQSLACAKFKVLKKHPPGRDVSPEDSFSFNNDFSADLQKIKISTISVRVESGEERKETQEKIDEERRHQIEACVVRIMKDRKHMTHTDLVNEVARQLGGRFKPDPSVIKKRIEGLIEREYLERCDDRKSYNYLA